jgi:two-component system response regulator HydG
MTSGAAEKLMAYRWPGNVRELRNCIEAAVALTRFEQIGAEDLPQNVRDFKPSHVLVVSDDPEELVPLEVVERRYIEHVLEATAGNKSLSARILGLDRKTLVRRLSAYGDAAADKKE